MRVPSLKHRRRVFRGAGHEPWTRQMLRGTRSWLIAVSTVVRSQLTHGLGYLFRSSSLFASLCCVDMNWLGLLLPLLAVLLWGSLIVILLVWLLS